MLTGGKKFQKPTKTKFKKNRDKENQNLFKPKHHDKSVYRLAKQDKEDYVIQRTSFKTNRRIRTENCF